MRMEEREEWTGGTNEGSEGKVEEGVRWKRGGRRDTGVARLA